MEAWQNRIGKLEAWQKIICKTCRTAWPKSLVQELGRTRGPPWQEEILAGRDWILAGWSWCPPSKMTQIRLWFQLRQCWGASHSPASNRESQTSTAWSCEDWVRNQNILSVKKIISLVLNNKFLLVTYCPIPFTFTLTNFFGIVQFEIDWNLNLWCLRLYICAAY